jgi:hypothetical protein
LTIRALIKLLHLLGVLKKNFASFCKPDAGGAALTTA